jgi:pyridoxal phosphate enzyme (YggS family)
MATIPTPLQQRLAEVRARIAKGCEAAGRTTASVRLLAVSKTFPADAVREAAAAGQVDFGENYVQEAVDKIAALRGMTSSALIWHFIGPIQSNKTRPIAENFDWVHSIDRDKIARRLSEQRPDHLPPLEVCIEVNVSGEASKSGVTPAEVGALAHLVAGLPRLKLRGLMAIPEPTEDMTLQRQRFATLRGLLEALQKDGLAVDTLSMGMTADMDAAIAEGATMVRIGTAIFGARQKQNNA